MKNPFKPSDVKELNEKGKEMAVIAVIAVIAAKYCHFLYKNSLKTA